MMGKCEICGKEATTKISNFHFNSVTGAGIKKKEISLCEEHNTETWRQFEKKEMWASLAVLGIVAAIPLSIISFIFSVILNLV